MTVDPPIRDIERGLVALRRIVLVVGAFVVVIATLYASEFVVGRQTLTVRVLQADVPRYCREGHGSRGLGKLLGDLVSGRRGRDFAPPQAMTYCGEVSSDHGDFKLPESTRLAFGPWRREALFDQLREGCLFEVTVSGYGADLRLGTWSTNRPKTLRRLRFVGGCPI
ncbi:hypothetical protein FHG66_21230 [Rubellimicrobium rubrum]|uniref:Uncharacterized protein n=1 Tax=Rubellimicrobium rubrum TaxID=2585369 RepID=A0A5C4MFV6_9RHOB|nr:hypothetical protein [Rubellimicrobium rubrum]TNC42854.1 hypothetical protein FHG66_21230 [Rubellimicrobium rubrum]